MSTIETEAIILRTYRLSEADKIVVALTRSEGVVRGVARGARRLKSQFGAGLEPFTHVALSLYAKEGRELLSFKRAEIIKSYFALSSRPEVLSVLEQFGQMVLEFAPPHQPDEKIFRLMQACLEAVWEDFSCAHTIQPYFELWMLKLNGFLPDWKTCGACARKIRVGREAVNMTTEGSLRCESCAGGAPYLLSAALHGQLYTLTRLAPRVWARGLASLHAAEREKLYGLATRLTTRALERQPGANNRHGAYVLGEGADVPVT